jgi:hypothetical protein
LQRVGFVQHETTLLRKPLAQERGQITVDLNRIERSVRLEEELRHRAAAGADFHQVAARHGRDGLHNAADHRGVVQEMLSEALSCAHPQLQPFTRRRAARCSATCTAAVKLP